jgi:hypothetical protein
VPGFTWYGRVTKLYGLAFDSGRADRPAVLSERAARYSNILNALRGFSVSLFRLLSALTVVIVIAIELLKHLPAWAMTALAYLWVGVLMYAAFEGWRETQRDRAARSERERLRLHRS